MITCNPYTLDNVIYPKLPPRHRWILNKLELAIRLGIPAGPCGTRAPRGDLCVRPIMNVEGMGEGGFFKVPHNEGGLTRNRPGYFWTPWLDGEHHYIYYVKDKPWYDTCGIIDDAGRMTVENHDPKYSTPLPKMLRRISRYMMLQTIDGVVTEVSPRHGYGYERQEVVDDYKKINPAYEAPDNPFVTSGMILERYERDPYGMTGWVWGIDDTTAYPFVNKFGKG